MKQIQMEKFSQFLNNLKEIIKFIMRNNDNNDIIKMIKIYEKL